MRLKNTGLFELFWQFQFTHPWGCDQYYQPWHNAPAVSIHAPVRMRPIMVYYKGDFYVSIHAPVRMRQSVMQDVNNKTVSIHAPVRMRLITSIVLMGVRLFQFTHPWGCDSTVPLVSLGFSVSIHAPVRMRQYTTDVVIAITVSIHAPVRMRRDCRLFTWSKKRVSIHAPVRMRHTYMISIATRICFNSRTREDATLLFKLFFGSICVSIHAPVRMRHQHLIILSAKLWFQFTHPWGCDSYQKT